MIGKDSYDLLMCDSEEKHLEKVEKKILEREGIRLEQYQFDAITLYDCYQHGKQSDQPIKRQISTKGIEIHLKLFKKIELTVNIKNITFRFLE